jgi:hypothetical protein
MDEFGVIFLAGRRSVTASRSPQRNRTKALNQLDFSNEDAQREYTEEIIQRRGTRPLVITPASLVRSITHLRMAGIRVPRLISASLGAILPATDA